jgi:hypothetical protein
MPSNKSTAEKVLEKRELACKKRKYYLIVLCLSFRWLISFGTSCSLQHVSYSQGCQRHMNANGANEPVQSFFHSETDDGSEGNGSHGGSTGYVQSV